MLGQQGQGEQRCVERSGHPILRQGAAERREAQRGANLLSRCAQTSTGWSRGRLVRWEIRAGRREALRSRKLAQYRTHSPGDERGKEGEAGGGASTLEITVRRWK